MGDVDIYWNRYLKGVLFCDLDEVSTLIAKVCKRHYYYINLRDDLNYTYLDLSLYAKRFTDAVLHEQDLLEYSLTSASKPPIKGAIVRGAGRQFASVLDARMRSPYFRVQEYSNTFRRDLGMLKSLASDYSVSRMKETRCRLRPVPKFSERPGQGMSSRYSRIMSHIS